MARNLSERAGWGRRVLILLSVLLCLGVVEDSLAQIVFRQDIQGQVTVSPSPVILVAEEDFSPREGLGKAWIHVVPDQPVNAETEDDKRAIAFFNQMASAISGRYPSDRSLSDLPPVFREIVASWAQGAERLPPGIEIDLHVSFENDPDKNTSLPVDGFEVIDQKVLQHPEKGPVTFRMWAKADVRNVAPRGKGRARIELIPQIRVDPARNVYMTRFTPGADPEIEHLDPPRQPDIVPLGRAAFEDFEKRVRDQVTALLAQLNGEHPLASGEQLDQLLRSDDGLRSQRTVALDWMGEPKNLLFQIMLQKGTRMLENMPVSAPEPAYVAN